MRRPENLVEIQLKKAREDLKRCEIRSRIEGRIVEDEVEEGDYLKPGDVLAHISDGSQMEVKTKLRAEELAWVWQQHEVQQTLASLAQGDPLTAAGRGVRGGVSVSGAGNHLGRRVIAHREEPAWTATPARSPAAS